MNPPIDHQFKYLLREGKFNLAHTAVDKLIDMCAANMPSEMVDVKYPVYPETKADNMLVYLPVEIKDRELESKCKLARHLIHLGFDVVLGSTWSLNQGHYKDLPPGIVLFKTLNEIDGFNMKNARANGHVVYALDEEAFSRPNTENAYKINTSQAALAEADWVLTQSQGQEDVLCTLYPDHHAKFFTTGNPRVEILQSKAGAGQNDYNLVCGMTGTINGIRGLYLTISATIKQLFRDSNRKLAIDMLREACHRELDVFPEIVQTIHTNKDVVFRPHPSEDAEFWYDWLETGNEDDPLIREYGSASDLMRDAIKVFHVAECGTGIEAAIMKVARQSLGGEQPPLDKDMVNRNQACQHIAEFMLFNSVKAQMEGSRKSFLDTLKSRRGKFSPTAFHKRKFPYTENEEISNMVGCDVKHVEEVEHNLWYLEAAKIGKLES